jgi:hypothetical protein
MAGVTGMACVTNSLTSFTNLLAYVNGGLRPWLREARFRDIVRPAMEQKDMV